MIKWSLCRLGSLSADAVLQRALNQLGENALAVRRERTANYQTQKAAPYLLASCL
jgi:hypothetical protein